MSNNIHDMADDFGKALMAAGVVLFAFVFCLGIMVGAFIAWGLQ